RFARCTAGSSVHSPSTYTAAVSPPTGKSSASTNTPSDERPSITCAQAPSDPTQLGGTGISVADPSSVSTTTSRSPTAIGPEPKGGPSTTKRRLPPPRSARSDTSLGKVTSAPVARSTPVTTSGSLQPVEITHATVGSSSAGATAKRRGSNPSN